MIEDNITNIRVGGGEIHWTGIGREEEKQDTVSNFAPPPQ